MCFDYILVTFCINIYFSGVVTSFAWIIEFMLKTGLNLQVFDSWKDVETVDEKEEERRWSQKKESTIENKTSVVADVRAASAAAMWEWRGRKYRRGQQLSHDLHVS